MQDILKKNFSINSSTFIWPYIGPGKTKIALQNVSKLQTNKCNFFFFKKMKINKVLSCNWFLDQLFGYNFF